jgi:hypothetical protein
MDVRARRQYLSTIEETVIMSRYPERTGNGNAKEAEEVFVYDSWSEITQELKSTIKCWCYEHHQHCTNPCHGNVSSQLTVSQHTGELCEFSTTLRPSFARYLASRSLS